MTAIKAIDFFVSSSGNRFMLEIAEQISSGFEQLGLRSTVLVDKLPSNQRVEGVMQIIVAPHEYVPLFMDTCLSRGERDSLLQNSYILNTEQPGTKWFRLAVELAPHVRGIIDINRKGIKGWRDKGFEALSLPLGYSRTLEAAEQKSHQHRPTEILFLGALTPKRAQFFSQHAAFFSAHRSRIHLARLQSIRRAGVPGCFFGEDLKRLLASARILVNVHMGRGKYFEWHRVLLAAANRCVVVSEPSSEYGPLVPGEHFLMPALDEIPEVCEHLLLKGNTERIAARASDFIQRELSQHDFCARFLEQLSTPGTATQPTLAPRKRRPILGRRGARLLRNAQTHLLKMFSQAAQGVDKAKQTDALAQSSIRTKEDQQTETGVECQFQEGLVRRGRLRTALYQIEQLRLLGKRAYSVWHNPAYKPGQKPAVSVLITLFNYEQYIEPCCRSVADSAVQELPGGIELVIVDDHSTDSSLARARAFASNCSLPTVVVEKELNSGLADARNTGLEVARGTAVFILDADNLIYPNCLAQLWSEMQAQKADAVYSLIAKFDGHTGERLGLISSHAWDGQELLRSPYVDAMALFKRDNLLAVGGYNIELGQRAFLGWEDYYLWCVALQKGWKIVHLPNLLCLYRTHKVAMSATMNLFTKQLVLLFADAFQDLVQQNPHLPTFFMYSRAEIALLSTERHWTKPRS